MGLNEDIADAFMKPLKPLIDGGNKMVDFFNKIRAIFDEVKNRFKKIKGGFDDIFGGFGDECSEFCGGLSLGVSANS